MGLLGGLLSAVVDGVKDATSDMWKETKDSIRQATSDAVIDTACDVIDAIMDDDSASQDEEGTYNEPLMIEAAVDEIDKGFRYQKVGGHAVVLGLSEIPMEDTSIVIPKVLGGVLVTEIAPNAFNDCGNAVSVTFPETIKMIGKGAFSECDKLPAEKNSR